MWPLLLHLSLSHPWTRCFLHWAIFLAVLVSSCFQEFPGRFFPSFHVLFIFKNCLFDMVSLCDSMDFERLPPPAPFHECWNYRGVAPMPTILQHSIGGLDRLVTLGHCGHINRMIVWRARANQGRWWVTALLVVWLPSFVRLTRIKGFLGFLSSRMALRW